MPQPTNSQVHEDVLLTDLSIAYKQDAQAFIADKIFPFLGVGKQTNKYRKYNKNDWFRDTMQLLGPGAEAAETGYGLSTDTYACDVWALGHLVDEQIRANYDQPGDAETDTAQHLMQLGLIRRERQWMTKYFAGSIWGTTIDGSANGGAGTFVSWDDAANSDPKKDVQTGVKKVLSTTGFKPNTMVVGYSVHQALTRHPLIRDQFKYTSADSINEEMLARYFSIDRYFVSESIYATNNEGASSETYAFTSGPHCLLVYSAPRPSLMQPSGGYTFGWTGLTAMNNLGIRMLTIPAPLKHGDKIEIQMAFDMKLVASDMGYMLTNAATT